MMIGIRSVLDEYITIDDILFDTFVWLKVNPLITGLHETLYICCAYLPPDRSSFFKFYDCDIFFELENQIASYFERGKVMLAGDLNCRCANLKDFIDSDVVHDSIRSTLFDYESDEYLPDRNCPDRNVNTYGIKLIQLCIESGLRILNGRLDFSSDFTYCGPNGSSVLDYLLTTKDMFYYVQKFIVCNFNMYSDHAPLHIELKSIFVNTSLDIDDSECLKHVKYRWSDTFASESKTALEQNLHRLELCIQNNDINTENGLNNCVTTFIQELSSIMSDFHKVPVATGTGSTKKNVNIDKVYHNKPWFNDTCRHLYSVYRKALYDFNVCKTPSNHFMLQQSKNDYKTLERKLKRRYLFDQGNMLDTIRKQNPKEFYARFSKKKHSKIDIDIKTFFEHFKSLCGNDTESDENSESDAFMYDDDIVFDELNVEITEDEILKCIKGLKRNKSHSSDGILNEYFIEYASILLPLLKKIFNAMFNTGFFPPILCDALVVPVYKKGSSNDPKNYRGISLISCMCKLFTSILNSRLILWSDNNDVITDAQFGFRSKHSTVDAIFALHTIISKHLSNKSRLYCCFIDYKQAFDSIDRDKLWSKLMQLGLRGRILVIIKSLYKQIKTRVLLNGKISQPFVNYLGLLQGR